MDSDLLKKKEISWMWGNGRVKGKAEEQAQKFGDQVALKIHLSDGLHFNFGYAKVF